MPTIRTPTVTAPIRTTTATPMPAAARTLRLVRASADHRQVTSHSKIAAPGRARQFDFQRQARSAEPAAIVRRCKVEERSNRDDAGWIHMAVAAVIMPLDVIEIDGPATPGT